MDHNEAASDPEEGLDVTLSGMLDHRTTARGPCIVLCMVYYRTHKTLFFCIFILSCMVLLYLSFSMFNYVCVDVMFTDYAVDHIEEDRDGIIERVNHFSQLQGTLYICTLPIIPTYHKHHDFVCYFVSL